MPLKTQRRASLALTAMALLAVALYSGTKPDVSQPLVFALEVSDPDGRVLGSPLVLGGADQTLTVRLMCERNPAVERLSITLDPISIKERGGDPNSMRYSWELSVAGRVHRERGTLDLPVGDERRIEVGGSDPARQVRFAVYAAPVSHPGVESYLQARKLRLSRSSS